MPAVSAVPRPFSLPDRITSLPTTTFTFSPAAQAEAAELLEGPVEALHHRLLTDQESEVMLLVARTVVDAFLRAAEDPCDIAAEADVVAEQVHAERERISTLLAPLATADPAVLEAVRRQRAPLALLAGCWLDTVSNPATQPSIIVNHLFRHHFVLKGEGEPQRSLHHLRRRSLEAGGTHLPPLDAVNFLSRVEARPLTAWHAVFYLSLSRLPANLLPEIVGVHYVVNALGVDDLVFGSVPVLTEPKLRAALAEYLGLTGQSPTGVTDRRRLLSAVRLASALEREHAALLSELASWHAGLSLDAKVAEIIQRHAPFAGRQHRGVKIAGQLLATTLGDENLDIARFLTDLRDSHYVNSPGEARFLRALKLGGPMFGIFDEREGAVLREWVTAAREGVRSEITIPVNRIGDEHAERWRLLVTGHRPSDIVIREPESLDDRRFLHRLVNIENFAHLLPLAQAHAEQVFTDAEVLFTHGAQGMHTDASWFDYSPEALLARVDAIYWEKLVDPYQPLTQIPDRDEVVFGQKLVALASLLDGTWSCRTGNVGRYARPSDGMLFAIYADEMGRGDLRKNHITMIHQVLGSMEIHLPHLRDADFIDQDELPETYGFGLHQLCMSLFPDTFYNEILGYNLCVEMFGLGRVRLQEIQKLRRYGFDTTYEAAHLSIDNFSTGHARQAAEIIIAYLDGVRREVGADAVPREWRRIWRGYASFAYFVESALLNDLNRNHITTGSDADLLI
ncbi:iron-containing redox enzyme family protein [Micromonospora sp. HNM0581]|uniref:iron-containing redox enzyme family protein n=1 Tax=Micromonospora sp. HNM0581 TaxID=2716341 RepID=UPI00146EEE4F|nr:iron-containing redox enzyme family protein [Micromonospora sp. HNM0581]NLU80654.1 iron-containing redox enzyme family protein [Micromonospora sp. HNM0581]